MTNPLELLAPAGDWDMLRAAVANGADAVYFGLEGFNARLRATNFRLQELPEVMRYLRRHNVRGYVAFNTLVFSDELPRAAEFIAAIAQAGADAVIVQDLGLARLIRAMAPTLPVHASTQMTLTEPRSIAFVKALGAARVILPRELSLQQIAELSGGAVVGPEASARVSCETEVFVHGAICISFSGQCWASQALLGRSGNRGQCGQACRLPYKLVVDGQVRDLPHHAYLLSPGDLAAYDLVAQLSAASAVGLKIEGRLKGPHYVAAATRIYRQAIDAAGRSEPFAISPAQQHELAMTFSRGFTHGFLQGQPSELVAGDSPKSRGARVGVVTGRSRRGLLVRLDAGAKCAAGDGVVFEAGLGDQEPGGRVFSAALRGSVAELTFGNDVDLSVVAEGCVVWKTDDPPIRRDLEATYARDVVARPVPLIATVRAAVGVELELDLTDDRGNRVAVRSDVKLEQARKHPLTAEVLAEQLGRLGGTPFTLQKVELVGLAGPCEQVDVLAPKSVLNDLRRQAVEKLLEFRDTKARHELASPEALESLRARITPGAEDAPSRTQLAVLARTHEQAEALAQWVKGNPASQPALVYLDFADSGDLQRAMLTARAAGLSPAVATPRILMPGQESILEDLLAVRPEAVLVRNLGAMEFYRERAPDLRLIGDASLNVANELTARVLLEAGLERLTPSFDLNSEALQALVDHAPPDRFEIVLYQHPPMFHMAYDLLAAELEDRVENDAAESAGTPPLPSLTLRAQDFRLRDRNEVDHPIRRDASGHTTVFHGHARAIWKRRWDLQQAGVRHFRIELLDESEEQTRGILEKAVR